MLEKIQKGLDILSAAKDANSAKILKELFKIPFKYSKLHLLIMP
jgi:hypothetical protein